MTITISDAVRDSLHEGDPLRAVLAQRSRAYGSVAGALDSLVAQDSDDRAVYTQLFRALVDAIHYDDVHVSSREDARGVARELERLGRAESNRRWRADNFSPGEPRHWTVSA
jgi:hypothetical protein